MATFRKLPSGKTQAIICKKGFPRTVNTFRTKTQAVDWARRVEDEMVRGLFRDTSRAERTTVADMCDHYERDILPRKRSPGTLRSQLKYIREHLGAISLAALTPEHIIGYVDWRLKAVAGESVRKEVNTLSRVIVCAQSLWSIHLQANPVTTARQILSFTKTIAPGKQRERRVSEEEIELLCQYSGSLLLAHIIRFAVLTALRRGEIANMRRDHIRGNQLHIPRTKTDRPRTIPLNSGALAILNALPARLDGQVFGLRPDSITQAFDRAAKRAGLTDITFHDLRHEATSRLFEKGLQVQEVAAISGHTDWRSLKRYTHPQVRDLAQKLR
jgi:integrase